MTQKKIFSSEIIFEEVPTSCTIAVNSPEITFVKIHLRIIRHEKGIFVEGLIFSCIFA